MKKVIRLTESDLERIIKKVINEQSRKFFEVENGNIIWTRVSATDGEVVDTQPYKMPEYFKPYIGLTVSEYDFTQTADDLFFGGGRPILKIGALHPAYKERNQKYNPEKYGFEGVMAKVNVGTKGSSEFLYYDCAGKQWKITNEMSDLRDQKLFNKKFFELGNFIQSKFCNSYITKPRREDT